MDVFPFKFKFRRGQDMSMVLFVALLPSWQQVLWRGYGCNVELLGPWVGGWSQPGSASRALGALTLCFLLEIHG